VYTICMQFRVPQFIDVEDKLFGPLTFKQFIYLLGGGAACFVIWNLIPIKVVALVVLAPFAGLSVALAFMDYNGKPFMFTLEAAVNFYLKNKLYIWKKIPKKKVAEEKEVENKEEPSVFVPRLSDSKLKQLTWGLDVYDSQDK
jgi:PrgI family protein